MTARCGLRPGVVVWIVLPLTLVAGCVSHPGLPATGDEPYLRKSILTAEAARSAVATVRLGLDGLQSHGTTEVYLDDVVSDQEEILAGVTGSFSSITPPTGRSDRVRARLTDALALAGQHLADIRIALRRGHPADALDLRSALDDDARAFEAMSR